MKLDAASFEPRSIDAFLDAQCAVRLCRFDTAPWVFAEARSFVLSYRSPDDAIGFDAGGVVPLPRRCYVDSEEGAEVFYVCDAARCERSNYAPCCGGATRDAWVAPQGLCKHLLNVVYCVREWLWWGQFVPCSEDALPEASAVCAVLWHVDGTYC